VQLDFDLRAALSLLRAAQIALDRRPDVVVVLNAPRLLDAIGVRGDRDAGDQKDQRGSYTRNASHFNPANTRWNARRRCGAFSRISYLDRKTPSFW
jgi:hypothetical protein